MLTSLPRRRKLKSPGSLPNPNRRKKGASQLIRKSARNVMKSQRIGLVAAKVVLKTRDVVFAQIAAKLHLHNFNRFGRAVREAMNLAEGDIAMLADRERYFPRAPIRVAKGNDGCAAHHDPMLCALRMLLQAELFARVYTDAFDFQAWRFVDGFIPSPRALRVFNGLVAISGCAHAVYG